MIEAGQGVLWSMVYVLDGCGWKGWKVSLLKKVGHFVMHIQPVPV